MGIFDFLIFFGETVASGVISHGQESFFDKIFGREVNYKSFYDQIRNIVKDELILNDLSKYQGIINAKENILCNDYEKNKNILSFKENEHKLNVFSNEVLTIINILEDEYYKERSEVIAIYMEASYLYLYLQQEIVRQIDLAIAKGEKISDIGRKKENTISVIKDEAKRFKAGVGTYFKSLLKNRIKHYAFKTEGIILDLRYNNIGKFGFIYFDDLSFEMNYGDFPGSPNNNDIINKHKETLKNRLQTVLLINKFYANMDKLQNLPVPALKKDAKIKLKIQADAYCGGKKWLGYKDSNMTIGTTGESRRLNAMRMKITQAPEDSPNIGIEYRVFQELSGWHEWKKNGMDAGNASDNNYRISAIQIRLINNKSDHKIVYRSHMQRRGWSEWVSEGETAGVTHFHVLKSNQEYIRLEAFEFMIV